MGGLERVYENQPCNFRNEGISTRHNPEFTMIEFYQAYTDYRGLMDLSEELLRQLAIDVTGSNKVPFGDVELDFSTLRRLHGMREAVIEYWEGPDRPSMDNVRDPEWLKLHGELAHLFEAHAERKLIQPTRIYDLPVEVSPLSKNIARRARAQAIRFEIMIAKEREIGKHRVERSHGAAPSFRRPARSRESR